MFAKAYGWDRRTVLFRVPWREMKIMDAYINYDAWRDMYMQATMHQAEWNMPEPDLPDWGVYEEDEDPEAVRRGSRSWRSLKRLQSKEWDEGGQSF